LKLTRMLGLWVDKKWRPKDDAGTVPFKNVMACGSLIGGIDYAKEGLGLGFMASTGGHCVVRTS